MPLVLPAQENKLTWEINSAILHKKYLHIKIFKQYFHFANNKKWNVTAYSLTWKCCLCQQGHTGKMLNSSSSSQIFQQLKGSHGNLELQELHETELLRVHACIPGDPGSRGASRSSEE